MPVSEPAPVAFLVSPTLQVLLVGLKHGGTLTGGGYGLVVPPLSLPMLADISTERIACFAVLMMVLIVGGSVNIMRSRIGRAWLAVRDNEPAAQMQGINVSQMKILAFRVGAESNAGLLAPELRVCGLPNGG